MWLFHLNNFNFLQDYEGFHEANENDDLKTFLKLWSIQGNSYQDLLMFCFIKFQELLKSWLTMYTATSL